MKPLNTSRLGLFALATVLASGCATTPRSDLPANANPNDELTRLKGQISDGDKNDFSVLDQEDFKQSKEHLVKAESMVRDNKNQGDVLSEIGVARGYYAKAEKIAVDRRSHVQPILDARSLAVSSGALQYANSKKDLEGVDSDARDLAEKADTPSSEKVTKLQNRYAEIQLTALTEQQLGKARATIEAARSQDASSKAPKTFNQAKTDYETAKNAISMNRSSPSNFSGPVQQATLTADTLARVMEMSRKSSKNFNEDEAVRIVYQDRKIHALDSQVSATEEQNGALAGALTQQQKDLRESHKKVAMQRALQDAQNEFSEKEAEVYQKDNQLLIRLKAVNFKSGSSTLPSDSNDLLAKVQSVVEGLKPESILIQGHTDSVGAKNVNEKLSVKRAEEVATYFEKNGLEASKIKTEGYGDAKPLATNKTKEGRAQNRRIDILVTPSGTEL